MKKLTLMMLAIVALVMASCSTKDEAQNVAKKIEASEPLTEANYTVILDYLGDFAEKAQPIQDKINNSNSDNPDYASQLASLKAQYPLVDTFNEAIEKANANVLGVDNMALLNKYAPLEWFTAPTWFTDMPDPDVAGEIVETPPAGDSDGVIAGAVDQAEKVVK